MNDSMTLELIPCPEPTCDAIAEITSRWVLASTDGLVEHLQTRCLDGHVFTPAAEFGAWE
jgi:hypothetical protein